MFFFSFCFLLFLFLSSCAWQLGYIAVIQKKEEPSKILKRKKINRERHELNNKQNYGLFEHREQVTKISIRTWSTRHAALNRRKNLT